MKEAVLGATGNIGGLLTEELAQQGYEVKALSRSQAPQSIEGVEYAQVDAESAEDLQAATVDVSTLYVTLAVPYTTENWQRSWPVIMDNVILGAKTNGYKVVFLDNAYMYGQVDGPMTESTPVNPCSQKGEVRASIAQTLLGAMDRGEVNGVIARSADFYGPDTRISDRFFEGAYKEGKAYWMGSPDVLRAWSYTLDNAKALALLGHDGRAEQQIWHMPTAPAMKGTEFIALAGELLQRELEVIPVPSPDEASRKAFAEQAPEIAEMMYQYDHDYIFDSQKFQNTFGVQPTSYRDGFKYIFDTLARTI